MSVKATGSYRKYSNEVSDESVKKLYVAALDACDIHWLGELSATEFLVLYFVIKRTVKFGKTEVAIPLRHFREGVKSRDTGEVVIAGLTLTHETITAVLGRLTARGLVTFERKRDGNTYEMARIGLCLDAIFEPVTVEIGEHEVGKLPIPRSKKFAIDHKNEAENDEEGGVRKPARGGAEIRMRKQHKVNDRSKEQNLPVADAPGRAEGKSSSPSSRNGFATAQEAIAFSTARVTRSREEKAARAARVTIPTMDQFRALWQTAMLRHWPTVPVVVSTLREWGMFKQSLKTATLTVPVADVVEYAIEHWQTIINTQFVGYRAVKANAVGAAPNMNFFLQHFRRFIEAIANTRAAEERKRKVTTVTDEKKTENETAALKRELAAALRDKEKLLERHREDQRIIRATEKKLEEGGRPRRVPLRRESLQPLEDDDVPLGKWNG